MVIVVFGKAVSSAEAASRVISCATSELTAVMPDVTSSPQMNAVVCANRPRAASEIAAIDSNRS